MSDRIDDDLMQADDGGDAWRRLSGLSQAEPSAALRQHVLADIHRHTARRPWWAAILPSAAPQWAGLAAATVLGIGIGLFAPRGGGDLDQRMAQLETQLVAVNQQLLVSRLTATAPSERLAAALQAAMLDRRDPEIASALLQRAAIDTVPSVRSAAIEALGSEINRTRTAEQLLALLSPDDSPIVQMAIIDLILRHGDDALLRQLRERASAGQLHPALAGYVQDAMGALQT